MLSFFRRIINSRFGAIIAIGMLGVFALAFGALDVSGLRTGGTGGLTGGSVASVGGTKITAAELRRRAETDVDSARQQQPTLTIQQFLAGGGLDGTLDRLVSGMAFEQFGHDQGMVVSRRSIDGQLASIPGLLGPDGKFDPANYQRLLAERRMTDQFVRTELTRQTYLQQLLAPIVGASQVPQQLALPYASLLLEKRSGEVAFVPYAAAAGGAAAGDADVQAFYRRNIARYTMPERRAIRYALVTADAVKARATPTDADLAAAYNADRARFAARQLRTIESVVALDQNTANTIAAKVKGGASLADAARGAGLEPSTATRVAKAAFATQTSAALADAAFGAAKGALIGPVRAPLGWTVLRVTGMEEVAGKTLEQARSELMPEVAKRKLAETLSSEHDAIDDALAKSATFDEVVADRKLQPVTTQPLLANGTTPKAPGTRPDPALAPVIAAAFQMEEGDDPQLVQAGADGSFALVALGRVVHAAPRPLAEMREAVTRDLAADRARQAARRIAAQITAKVNKGMALGQAVAGAGIRLPAPTPLAAARADLARNPRGAPPQLVMLFSTPQGSARMLESPERGGWSIIRVDRIDRGDAARNAGMVAAARADLGRLVGREYAEQFARAVRAEVGVKTDAGAIAKVRSELLGGNDAGN